MLEEAIRLADSGKAVYVVSANRQHSDLLKTILKGIQSRNRDIGIKIETASELGFNWECWRVPGAHQNCVFLVDHYAIECKYPFIINKFHEFDKDKHVTGMFADNKAERDYGLQFTTVKF
jgi:hypothetical protein